MNPFKYFQPDAYTPEHIAPSRRKQPDLKSEIDDQNLTEMWDMILTLDYQVSDVADLNVEKREEFEHVMTLLLKAFKK